MAGSWNHITTGTGKFRGMGLIENLGDAGEALEECYGMVWWLAHALAAHDGNGGASPRDLVAMAQQGYRDGIHFSPGLTTGAKEQGFRG